MMVSLDSARQWYPREKLIACDADHSQIARLKRGESGIYTLILSAIKQAMLSVGDLYSDTDAPYNIPTMSQVYHSGKSSDDRSNLDRHRSVPLGSRSYDRAADQSWPDLEFHLDQGKDGNPGESRRGTHQLQRSSASYPYRDQKVPLWQLGVEEHGMTDVLLPQSPSISSESAMASMASEAHDAADNVFGSATSIDTDFNGTRIRSPASRVNCQGDEQLAPAKPLSTSDSSTAEAAMTNDLRSLPVIRTEQVAPADLGLAAKAGEAGTSDQGPQPIVSTAAPQTSRDTVIRKDEQVTTPQTQGTHEVEHGGAASADNQCIVPKSTTTGSKSTSYDNELKDAIRRGDIEGTKGLLATSFDVNCKDENGFTPLHDAAFFRNEPLVKLLLELGAHPRAKTIDGNTPLHFISHPKASQTPLTESLIDVLLQHRPPLEEANQEGSTPLMWAARRQELLLATKLISRGASVQRTTAKESTALHWAARYAKGPEVIALLIREGALVDAKDFDGWTPLHCAASNSADSVEAVKCLLQAGADKEATTSVDFTPLHVAAREGHAACVELLLISGANIEAKMRISGANIEAMMNTGSTPLLLAAVNGRTTCVKLLLNSGANIEATTFGGCKPLHIAAANGHAACVELLLISDANIEAKMRTGSTPLPLAAKNGRTTCVKLLLSSGANVEACDRTAGENSLHHAVNIGHLQIIKMLLAQGANPLARSKMSSTGQTPRNTPITSDSATEKQKREIRDVLKEAEKEWKRSGKKYSKFRLFGYQSRACSAQ